MSEVAPVVSPSPAAIAETIVADPVGAVTPNVTPDPIAPPVDEKPVVDEKPAEDDKFAHKFAALSRKERAVLAKEQALKEKLAKVQEFEDAQAQFEADPLGYIQKRYGKDYKYLTDRVLNNNEITPEQKVDEIQKKLDAMQRAAEEEKRSAAQKKYEDTIAGFTAQIGEFIKGNAEVYELTAAQPEAAEIVFNVIEQHHLKTGRIMSTEDAVKAVEAHLEAEAEKLVSLKKIKAKLAPPPVEEKKPVTGSTTLSNALAAGPTPTRAQALSIEESKREAARLLKWS